MNGNVKIATLLCCLALNIACAPSLAPLETAIQKKNWDVATAYASGDSALELYLATAIVQDAAKESRIPKSLVLALPASHPHGERALKQLAENSDHPRVAKLAQIVRHRNRRSRLSEKTIGSYLESEYREVRALAATTFADRLERETLHAMTRDINGTVRGASVAALCRMPAHPDTAAVLVERLQKDPLPHVRAAAARCGSGLGKNRSRLLRERIEGDKNPGVQLAATKGLLSVASQRDMAWLIRFCSGPMTALRLQVAAALAHRHLPVGKARLRDALNSGDDQIVAEAISLLSYGHITDIDGLLMPRLDGPPAVSTAAAEALLMRGAHVDDALNTLTQNWQNGDEKALVALVRAGNGDALKQVRIQLVSKTDVLKTIDTFETITGLHDDFVALLAHPNSAVRQNAAVAILRQYGK